MRRLLTHEAVIRLQRAAVNVSTPSSKTGYRPYCVLGLCMRYVIGAYPFKGLNWGRYVGDGSFPGPWMAADELGLDRDVTESVAHFNDAGDFDAAWRILRDALK